MNCDVTVYLNGFHGDTSRTFLVGNVDKEAKKLVKVPYVSSRNQRHSIDFSSLSFPPLLSLSLDVNAIFLLNNPGNKGGSRCSDQNMQARISRQGHWKSDKVIAELHFFIVDSKLADKI